MIAKFSSAGDTHDVVKAEFVAMRLAAKVGLDVAPSGWSIRALRAAWDGVMAEARPSEVECLLLQQRIFLNPSIFDGAPPRLQALRPV